LKAPPVRHHSYAAPTAILTPRTTILGLVFIADKPRLLTVADKLYKPIVEGIEKLKHADGFLQFERKQRTREVGTELHSEGKIAVI